MQFKTKFPKLIILILLFCLSVAATAHADGEDSYELKPKKKKVWTPLFEISLMGSLSKSNYGNGSYSKSQRATGSIAMYLTSTTEIELSYTDARTTTNYDLSPKTVTYTVDRTASLSIDQYLLSRSWFLQPYVKVGGAQLNRKQYTKVNGADQPDVIYKQPSGVLGAGLRLALFWSISFKVELTTYLPDFKISGAKDNYDWEAGLSLQF